MTILRHFSKFAPLSPLHFEDNWIFLTFHRFLIYQTWIRKNLAGFGFMLKKTFGGGHPNPPPFIQEGLIPPKIQSWPKFLL